MQFKKAKVIFLAETKIDPHGFRAMLGELDASEWKTDASSDGEALVEIAGRMCYRSFAPGLNPNVTKIREGNQKYIGNMLRQHHGSVLEHATVTFAFLNVTRVFTHEIVRHRAGTAYSQESLRYVRLDELSAYLPEVFDDCGEDGMRRVFEKLEDEQRDMAEYFDLDNEPSFNRKKKITSAMRRLAPIGLCTNIVMTANHRAWRHIIGLRCTEYAEEEVRRVMLDVAEQLKARFPAIYQDMVMVDGEARFENEKV